MEGGSGKQEGNWTQRRPLVKEKQRRVLVPVEGGGGKAGRSETRRRCRRSVKETQRQTLEDNSSSSSRVQI